MNGTAVLSGELPFRLAAGALIASGLYFLLRPKLRKEGGSAWARRLLGAGIVALGLLLPALKPSERVSWTPYSPELLTQAKADGMPVLLEFYASWCAPCLQMERDAFADPAVISALDSFARLKADVTDMRSAPSREILSRFGVASIPTLIFFDGAGNEIPDLRTEGAIKSGELLELLRDPRLQEGRKPEAARLTAERSLPDARTA